MGGWRGWRGEELLVSSGSNVSPTSACCRLTDPNAACCRTSDEHISIAQFLKASSVDGAIIVTTPQEVSIIDVRKEINFCRKVSMSWIHVEYSETSPVSV